MLQLEGLSRFAYAQDSSSRAKPDLRPPTFKLVRKDTSGHLPDFRLARLSKCVSCGLEWTSKKSAPMKRAHVNQCAKRHALTKDTIKILVEKEIAVSSPQNTPSSHMHRNETTLMDSVVPNSPVRKSKRHQVLSTLKSLPETRVGILNRARDILGPTDGEVQPQPTQQFGQSALARTRSTQHPPLLGINGSMEELPSTQLFGASTLRATTTIPERSVHGWEESSFLQLRASLFAQDSVSSSDRHKRPASPSGPASGNSRAVRRRLLQ